VTVTVNGANDGPTAADDTGSTDEDSAVTIDALSNDTDPDSSDTLSVSSLDTSGTIGDVTDNGNGTFDYDPNGQFEDLAVGESATDSFTYTIEDGNGGSDTATVTVTVNGANDGPTAVDDTGSTDEDSAVTIDVLANDTDPDTSDVLSVSAVTQGSHGSVTNNGTDVTYDPDGQFEHLAVGESATDSFLYTVSDGHGGEFVATVTVTVNGANDGPKAIDDSVSTAEDTLVTVDVLLNDSDPDSGDSLVVSGVTQGSHGSVTNNGTDVTYNPDANFYGSDSFTYTAQDSQGATDTATVTVDISETDDMVVLGNGVVIAPGDTTPSTTDDTDFGNAALFLDTVEHTFTIENQGNIDLALTGSPRVDISGTHASDFTVTAQPASPVSAGSTTTFTIEYDPSAMGTRTAEVSIDHDDKEEPYTFAIQGSVTSHDTDGDGVIDNVEGSGDRDGDGIADYEDYDPTGYFYNEITGEIISGGSVSVSGPGSVTIVQDGSLGYYQFVTDGTPGTYTLSVTLPGGYMWSDDCLQGDPPAYDPTGMEEPLVLGNGENGSTGYLSSNACTSFYLTFELESGDPSVFNNNIPLKPRPLPDTGFAPGRVTELVQQPVEKSYQTLYDIWLEIPSLEIKTSLVSIPALEGVWDVTWLGDRAGYLEGTAFPTWAGNTVITGHVWDEYNRPGIFMDLKKLRYGDKSICMLGGECTSTRCRITGGFPPI